MKSICIRIYLQKCILFATKPRWWGRLISSVGIKYDPRSINGILSMEPPTTFAELQQFLCDPQWVKMGIKTFLNSFIVWASSWRTFPIRRSAKKRKSYKLSLKLQTEIFWSRLIPIFQISLQTQVNRRHRDYSRRILVFKDSSDRSW